MEDNYVMSSFLVDLEDNIVRPTKAVITSGAWFFGQVGTYTLGSPLNVLDGVKTKLSFNPANFSYTDGRNLSPNYDVATDKFHPIGVGDCFIVNFRFKMKVSSQAGHMDILLESPTVAFNPITARTVTFNKQAGDEQFQGLTEMIFISQDVSTNGLELFVKPHGTNVQLYDISLLISKQYADK
jgi:hypothetical protein